MEVPTVATSNANSDAPLVVIANTYEAYQSFLNQAEGPECDRLFQTIAQVGGERSLLWGSYPKLVITSGVVPQRLDLQQQLGLPPITSAFPTPPSPCLSLDILQQPALWQQLMDYAGTPPRLQLIPYATTPEFLQLVAALRQQGVAVDLPESPLPHSTWVRHYSSTKVGFRALVGEWLDGTHLVEGYIADNLDEAVAIAHWFTTQQRPCLVKPNRGFLGIGHSLLRPEQLPSPERIHAHLSENPFLRQDRLVVEAYLAPIPNGSPSVEVVVPAEGNPEILMVCTQLISGTGHYVGEVVSPETVTAPWYRPLTDAALMIAQRLQALGYRGHFDLDGLIDHTGQLYLVDLNPRRTGGSHIHDLACYLLGPDYLERVTILSRTQVSLPPTTEPDFQHWRAHLQQVLYPMQGKPEGVILTHTGNFQHQQIGYVLFAPTGEAALALEQTLEQILLKTIRRTP